MARSVRNAADSLAEKSEAVQSEASNLMQQGEDKAAKLKAQLEDRLDSSKEMVKAKLSNTELLLGEDYSVRRTIIGYFLAFCTASVIRIACLSPRLPIFGPYLQKTLAPIERDDVSWIWIAVTRMLDLCIAAWTWSAANGKVDGRRLFPMTILWVCLMPDLVALVGILLTGISRPTIYQFFHHHFLLGTKTMIQVILTDVSASAAALGVLSSLLPRPPSFRPPPVSWVKRHLNSPALQSVVVALSLGILLDGLATFVADRTYMHAIMKKGVLEHMVPSYFATKFPSTAFLMKHPLIPVPTLRTDFSPLSMYMAIVNSVPFVFSAFLLSVFVVPSLPESRLQALVFSLTAPSAFIALWNLLPVEPWAAAIAALDMGVRQTAVVSVIAWVLADLRRPVEVRGHIQTSKRVVGREIDGTKIVQEQLSAQ